MFKGIKEFFDTLTPILIIKLILSLGVIILCFLSLFLNGKLLGYGLIGAGVLVLTYGIESKIKNRESFTLLISVVITLVLFSFSGYILTNPLV